VAASAPDGVRARLVLLAAALASGVLGLTLLLAGGGAWATPDPTARAVGAGLGLGAAATAGILIVPGREGWRPAATRYAPRLYPFWPARAQFGLFALQVVAAATVVSSIFAEYAGALNGGNSAGVPEPSVSSALYVGASVVLWAYALWFLGLIAASVRIGRTLELRRGANVYGAVRREEGWTAPHRGVAVGPRPAGLTPALVVAAVAIALPTMAGIQTLEAGADPASPIAWLALQLFTPLWAGGLGFAVVAIDGHVRTLERAYGRDPEPAAPLPVAADGGTGGPGFVHG